MNTNKRPEKWKNRVLLLILILTGLIILTITPTVTAPVWYGSGDDTGLVGRWSCEGNFVDSSGQGNNGTQSGGVTINRGVKGRACGFDGVNDYVELSNSVITNKNFTVSSWVKTTSSVAGGAIYSESSTISSIPFTVPLDMGGFGCSVGQIRMTLRDDAGNINRYCSVNTYNNGAWHHVVATRNGNVYTIYVDGVNDTTTALSATIGTTTINKYDIGAAFSASSTPLLLFNGSIDEVRIYNRSLSASEVAALYNTSKSYHIVFKTTPALGGLNDTPAPTATDETGLVGWWKMDDLTNGNTTDSSGQGNNGSVIGATFNSGRWNKAYNFDQVDDYMLINDNTVFNCTDGTQDKPYSVSAWVLAQKASVTGTIMAKYTSTANSKWELITNGGLLAIYEIDQATGGYIGRKDSSALPVGVWTHVVGTYNGNESSTGNMLYINGAQTDDSTDQSGTYNGMAGSTTAVRIGARGDGLRWNGTIDEVRIYNRSLSADEVKELYLSKGLVGHWKMDADQRNTTDTYDSSGYYNHGKITGATFTNEGRFKEGYKFDGTDDFITMTDNPSLDLNYSFAISMWIKPLNTATGVLFDKWTGTGNQRGYESHFTSNKITWDTSPDGTSSQHSLNTTNTIPTNTWSHVTFSMNNGNKSIYINGLQEPTTSLITGVYNSSANLLFGKDSPYFNGTIDEVRIYNRALSATEVAQLYNGTKSNKIVIKTTPTQGLLNDTPAPTATDETGLVGWWKMDDLTNGNTTDSSGQNNNGSVIGATFNSGRWNNAYGFDGVNDYVNVGNATNLDIESSGTVSAWIKINALKDTSIVSRSSDSSWNGGRLELFVRSTGIVGLGLANGTTGGSGGIRITSAGAITAGNWVNIAGTFNGTHGQIYVNGINSGIGSGTYNYVPEMTGYPLYIGWWNGLGYFNGTIDEVRIYNRSLSADEVKELYLSKGLVGHWKMDADQKNSTSTFDTSGYYNHGLISGATFTNEGRFKEGYKFDGVNDVVTVPYSKSLDFGNSSKIINPDGFSFGAWVKSNSDSQVTSAHVFRTSGDAYGIGGSGNAYGCNINNATGTITQTATTTTTWPGQWKHLLCIVNNTHLAFYIDGVYFDDAAHDNTITTGWTSLLLGYEGASTRYFNGSIDEVRIYNRALTSQEVAGLYNGTKGTHLTWYAVKG